MPTAAHVHPLALLAVADHSHSNAATTTNVSPAAGILLGHTHPARHVVIVDAVPVPIGGVARHVDARLALARQVLPLVNVLGWYVAPQNPTTNIDILNDPICAELALAVSQHGCSNATILVVCPNDHHHRHQNDVDDQVNLETRRSNSRAASPTQTLPLLTAYSTNTNEEANQNGSSSRTSIPVILTTWDAELVVLDDLHRPHLAADPTIIGIQSSSLPSQQQQQQHRQQQQQHRQQQQMTTHATTPRGTGTSVAYGRSHDDPTIASTNNTTTSPARHAHGKRLRTAAARRLSLLTARPRGAPSSVSDPSTIGNGMSAGSARVDSASVLSVLSPVSSAHAPASPAPVPQPIPADQLRPARKRSASSSVRSSAAGDDGIAIRTGITAGRSRTMLDDAMLDVASAASSVPGAPGSDACPTPASVREPGDDSTVFTPPQHPLHATATASSSSMIGSALLSSLGRRLRGTRRKDKGKATAIATSKARLSRRSSSSSGPSSSSSSAAAMAASDEDNADDDDDDRHNAMSSVDDDDDDGSMDDERSQENNNDSDSDISNDSEQYAPTLHSRRVQTYVRSATQLHTRVRLLRAFLADAAQGTILVDHEVVSRAVRLLALLPNNNTSTIITSSNDTVAVHAARAAAAVAAAHRARNRLAASAADRAVRSSAR